MLPAMKTMTPAEAQAWLEKDKEFVDDACYSRRALTEPDYRSDLILLSDIHPRPVVSIRGKDMLADAKVSWLITPLLMLV